MHAFMHAGADFRIVRIANAYGPGQDYRKGVGFIDAAIKRALHGETIEIWGNGNIVRDYIYIDDICPMLSDVLAYDGEEHTFNIGTGRGISQHTVISLLRKYIPDVTVEFLPQRNVDMENIVLDTSLYRKIFTYVPRTFLQGFHDYFTWLSSHKNT